MTTLPSKTLLGNVLPSIDQFEGVDALREKFIRERAVSDPEEFFHPDFAHLHDPYLLAGMDRAVERVLAARDSGERVIIFGDYDVDGISSTAMLARFLSSVGVTVSYRLPHRVHDGYGFKPHFLPDLAEKGVKLVITVDCGTRDVETVRRARELGIDTIITDHHSVPERVPEDVVALLNPRLPGNPYPFASLAGSGVAFKLLHALALRLFPAEGIEEILARYVDIACLGTIADCMPLVGENRTIAALGLDQLRRTEHHGLERLVSGRLTEALDADVVGFHIGPRINAAGRLGSPYVALRVLLGSHETLDEPLAELEALNTDRRSETERYVAAALANIDPTLPVLFFDSGEIPHGIIGLVAGRITQRYNRPSICLRREGEILVASCRSPEYFDIIAVLEEFRDWFVFFGGHKQAAGFTIRTERFEDFKAAFSERVAPLVGTTPPPKILPIASALPLDAIDDDLLDMLDEFRPYGRGNEKPLFLVEDFLFSRVEYLGSENRHLKFRHDALSKNVEFVAFSFGHHYDLLRSGKRVSLVVELDRRTWRDQTKIQALVRDVAVLAS